MIVRVAFVVLAAASLAPLTTAQLPGPGLTWTGSSGAYAGSYLPACSALPVATAAGESVTVRVWGDFRSPFALLAAASATQCLPFTGLGNALVLDLPVVPLAGGVLTLTSPCLSCPPAFAALTFTVPAVLPPGSTASLQAIGFGNQSPSFTVAVTATVQ